MATAVADGIEARSGSLRDQVVETVRGAFGVDGVDVIPDVTARAKRVVRRRVAEAADVRDAAIYRIKREPVKAVALAFGVGALAGVLCASLARACRGRCAEAKPVE
jgi:hypothetical protein